MFSKIALTAAAALGFVSAADKNAWRSRAVYQVLTDRFAKDGGGGGACTDLSNYCGGTWKGIEKHLDYIEGMGFDAIWISPVVDNWANGYHGYWAKDWTKTNYHFGSDGDLKSLVHAAHAKGMYVMVDVVANHVAPIPNDDWSQIHPFNSAEHYHPNCAINDWSNQQQVENCRLAGLPDLKQENQWVRDQLKSWISKLVKDFGFDGIRIDTIPEVPKDFWSEYGRAAGVFQMGECFNGDPAYVGPYQQHVTGLFNYPMYYTIKDVFGSRKSMYNIKNRFNEEQGHFNDIDALGIFVDNHDNARFLNQYSDQRMFKNALVFALTARGIPFYYYGSEQAYAGGNDPHNRESLWQDMNTHSDIYKMTAIVNRVRKEHKIGHQEQKEKYVTENFYAYSRGEVLVALTNSHDKQHESIPNAPWSDGTQVCNAFYPTTDCQTIKNKTLDVWLADGESKIYLSKSSKIIQEAWAAKEKEEQGQDESEKVAVETIEQFLQA